MLLNPTIFSMKIINVIRAIPFCKVIPDQKCQEQKKSLFKEDIILNRQNKIDLRMVGEN